MVLLTNSSNAGPLRRFALNRWRAAGLVEAARQAVTLYDTESNDFLELARIGRRTAGSICDDIALECRGCMVGGNSQLANRLKSEC